MTMGGNARGLPCNPVGHGVCNAERPCGKVRVLAIEDDLRAQRVEAVTQWGLVSPGAGSIELPVVSVWG